LTFPPLHTNVSPCLTGTAWVLGSPNEWNHGPWARTRRWQSQSHTCPDYLSLDVKERGFDVDLGYDLPRKTDGIQSSPFQIQEIP
jgi:hypothetical protein